MAIKEATVLEHPVPKGCYPWSMRLDHHTKDDKVVVSVHGAAGGKKAVFAVRFSELKDAVNKIE